MLLWQVTNMQVMASLEGQESYSLVLRCIILFSITKTHPVVRAGTSVTAPYEALVTTCFNHF